MHNFGKMTLTKFPIDHPVYKYAGIYSNAEGVKWHDLFKKYPYAFYAIIQDDHTIISWQEDPEQSQIDKIEIWGFTKREAKKRKDHTHFNGKAFYTPAKEPDLLDILRDLQERVERLENGNTDTRGRDGSNDCSGCPNCSRSQ